MLTYKEILVHAAKELPNLRGTISAINGEFGRMIGIGNIEMLQKISIQIFMYGCEDKELEESVRSNLIHLSKTGTLL